MSVLRLCIPAVLLSAPVATAAAAPATYRMDPTHTFVVLTRGNYGFSNPVIVANIERGTVVLDRETPSKSSISVTLPVSGLHTFVAQLDTEFRSAMFFDVSKFPDITYQSKRVQALGHGRYIITGTLVAHGVARPLVLHARLNKAGQNPMTRRQAIGFDATGTLKRSDFGLGFNLPNVSDTIALKLTMQADAIE